MTALRRYHAAVWDEPLVMELAREGRRGQRLRRQADGDASATPSAGPGRGCAAARRRRCPELSEPDVLRHYLHLSQETLGMMGISLFGTCTMKYNPRLGEAFAARPELAELHPYQDEETLQGVLELVHGLDLILRGLSGHGRVRLPGGRRRPRRVHASP